MLACMSNTAAETALRLQGGPHYHCLLEFSSMPSSYKRILYLFTAHGQQTDKRLRFVSFLASYQARLGACQQTKHTSEQLESRV